jgi:hypothetical protein
MSAWKRYRRTAVAEMRPYVAGEDRSRISVSQPDAHLVDAMDAGVIRAEGFVARNPDNHEDQWFVAQAYAEANFDLANPLEVKNE